MKMIKQRLMGLGLVAISALVVLMASGGTTPEDQDATAAVLIGPLGLYMMFTKTYILYDGEPVEEEPEEEPDPWAPSSETGALPHPLYPFIESPFYEQLYREETRTRQGKESSRPRASSRGRT